MPKATGAPKRRTAAPPPTQQTQPELDMSTDEFFVGLDEVEDFSNSVLYGREGSGKTTALAKMVNIRPTGKVLIVNAEGGVKKIALRKRGVDVDRIVTWPPPNKPITHKGLIQVCNRIASDLADDPNSWIGVGLDSATEIVQAILMAVQEKRVSAIKNSGKPVDENHVDIADYGDMSKMFRDVLRKFRDLPCHVVITALERRDVDKDTGKPQYGPAVTPGLQADLLGYVDFVLMLKAADEDGPFRALTRANSRYRAKDRFDVLPRVLAEPSLDRVVGYLNGTLTEEEDPFQADLPTKAKVSQDAAADAEDDEEDDDTDDE